MSFEKKKQHTIAAPLNQIASIMTDTNERDEEGQTQLSLAAEAGDVDEVARLLTDKADPELKDDDGFVRPRSFALRRVVWRKYDSVKYHLFSVKSLVLQIYAAP